MSGANLIISGTAILGALTGNLAHSPQVAMGGWASGGGQIHRDSSNPWFLENTHMVRYCIDIDDTHFGLSHEQASLEVKAALGEWIKVFNPPKNTDYGEDDYYQAGELEPYGQLRLGTQIFQEHDCSDNVHFDLRFQLGKLTDSQKKIFLNSRDFVGLAMRTHYEKESLKGEGFIYLTPVSGPLAPQVDIHPKAWKLYDSLVLKIVLLHELGHIFGMDHQPDTLMDEKIPELLTSKELLEQLSKDSQLHFKNKYSVSRLLGRSPDMDIEGCGGLNPIFTRWLFQESYVPGDCGKVILKNQKLEAFYKQDIGSSYTLIATATFRKRALNSTPAVSFYLPKEQQVFSKLPDEASSLNRLFGEVKYERHRISGLLEITATGEVLPLQLEISDTLSTAFVYKDHEFINDVFHLE